MPRASRDEEGRRRRQSGEETLRKDDKVPLRPGVVLICKEETGCDLHYRLWSQGRQGISEIDHSGPFQTAGLFAGEPPWFSDMTWACRIEPATIEDNAKILVRKIFNSHETARARHLWGRGRIAIAYVVEVVPGIQGKAPRPSDLQEPGAIVSLDGVGGFLTDRLVFSHKAQPFAKCRQYRVWRPDTPSSEGPAPWCSEETPFEVTRDRPRKFDSTTSADPTTVKKASCDLLREGRPKRSAQADIAPLRTTRKMEPRTLR